MNFKSIIISVVATVALITAYHFAFNNKKYPFAYIDTARLMTEYKGMGDVKKAIEAKTKIWQSNIDTLVTELQNDIKKYEKGRSKMSQREKQITEELIGRKQQQFMQYKEATQNNAAQEEQKIKNEALVKINSMISDFGKSHNYTIIFGTSSGNIVYAVDAINITNDVLDMLNKEYEKNKK